MSYGTYSDEVAEDYRKALEDLTMNSRYEISNLTVIAKENTEHALAISEALKNHIKLTSPIKKLPAFYVLDSVVKNVGTPYTLFFGRNLYSTFMEAYAMVDNNVRRKMEEMLRTWKEPVPGSLDPRPVFPTEVTKPIETALAKARESAFQAQQQRQHHMVQGRSLAPVPYRNTPTPPAMMRPVQQYPSQNTYSGMYDRGLPLQPQEQDYRRETPQAQMMMHQMPRPTSTTPAWQPPQSQMLQSHAIIVNALNNDLTRLIVVAKSDFAANPYDSSIQTRLKALLDLQSILQNQRLPPDQLNAIREQVNLLSSPHIPVARPAPPRQLPVTQVVPQPSAQQPTLSTLLGEGGLAALLARSSANPQILTPPQPQHVVPVRSPQPPALQPSYVQAAPAVAASSSTPDPTSLLDRLRAAGMLKTATPAPPVPSNTPAVPLPSKSTAGFPPPPAFVGSSVLNGAGLIPIPNDVELKPSSLKTPRPYLVSLLYERLGAPCSQCGRRFKSDEEGKKKKTAHMDWHFRVHQRMTESEKRGQHRSWYVDEMDWIQSRETDEEHLASAANGASNPADGGAVVPKDTKSALQYILVPENPPNTLCPICQEKFELKWLEEEQEFVWMDAKKVGDRIYHASCHAEVKKITNGNPANPARGTPDPDSVLGKRKNEDEHMSFRTKIKAEPIV